MFGTSDERRILWRHMREPVLTACALLVLATASISVRVALFGHEALPKPNPEEMPT